MALSLVMLPLAASSPIALIGLAIPGFAIATLF
jgi:hypothetical protein